MARQPDVVIIGGGAIGCSAAYYLRSEGLEVALVDKGPVAREASWASAGIIGPSSHPQGDPWFLQATRLSRQLYDDLNPVLFEETGRWMGYGGRGSMTLAMSPGEAAEAEGRRRAGGRGRRRPGGADRVGGTPPGAGAPGEPGGGDPAPGGPVSGCP